MTEKTNIQQREDNAKIKRVELNVYTKMSSFPSFYRAVVPTKELIRTAARWGWDAIAITDHEGVQAFPDAMNVVDDEKLNIKVIYGMVGNLIEENDFDPRLQTYVSILSVCLLIALICVIVFNIVILCKNSNAHSVISGLISRFSFNACDKSHEIKASWDNSLVAYLNKLLVLNIFIQITPNT